MKWKFCCIVLDMVCINSWIVWNVCFIFLNVYLGCNMIFILVLNLVIFFKNSLKDGYFNSGKLWYNDNCCWL